MHTAAYSGILDSAQQLLYGYSVRKTLHGTTAISLPHMDRLHLHKKRKMVYLIHCFKPNNLVFALLSSLSRMVVSEVNTLFR